MLRVLSNDVCCLCLLDLFVYNTLREDKVMGSLLYTGCLQYNIQGHEESLGKLVVTIDVLTSH